MPSGVWRKIPRPTIEPVIFLYAYALFMHLPVIQQYVYKRVSVAKGFPYSTSSKGSCSKETLNSTLKELEKEVNSDVQYHPKYQTTNSVVLMFWQCNTIKILKICNIMLMIKSVSFYFI